MSEVDLSRVGPLLTTVVSNLAVDRHRGRTRGAKVARRLEAERLVQPAVDDDVCDVEEARWLRSRLSILPAQDARVLELRAQGLSPAEAAGRLGITIKAADSAFTRARGRMQAVWRTTAALIWILWVRPLWHVRAPAPAATAMTALAAVFVLAFPAPPPANGAPSPLSTRSPAAPVPEPDAMDVARLQGPAASPRPASTRAPPAVWAVPEGSEPARRRIARAGGVDGTAGFSGGAVVVDEKEPDQSLSESLEQCLTRGITITLQQINCD